MKTFVRDKQLGNFTLDEIKLGEKVYVSREKNTNRFSILAYKIEYESEEFYWSYIGEGEYCELPDSYNDLESAFDSTARSYIEFDNFREFAEWYLKQ